MSVSTKPRRLRKLHLEVMGQGELGKRIKAARVGAGLTQPQLAARVGLEHPQSISKKRGPRKPSQKFSQATYGGFAERQVNPPHISRSITAGLCPGR